MPGERTQENRRTEGPKWWCSSGVSRDGDRNDTLTRSGGRTSVPSPHIASDVTFGLAVAWLCLSCPGSIVSGQNLFFLAGESHVSRKHTHRFENYRGNVAGQRCGDCAGQRWKGQGDGVIAVSGPVMRTCIQEVVSGLSSHFRFGSSNSLRPGLEWCFLSSPL